MIATLREHAETCWREVEAAHDAVTVERASAAADRFAVAIDAWREAIGALDAAVMTRVRFMVGAPVRTETVQ